MQCSEKGCSKDATHVLRTRVDPAVRPDWKCKEHASSYHRDLGSSKVTKGFTKVDTSPCPKPPPMETYDGYSIG